MATTINADTSTGGAIVTGDASGVLGLQAAGSTQVTINGSGVVLANPLPVGSGGTGATSLSGITVGTATSATTATNLAGGSNGTIPYQSAAGTTQMLAVGTAGQLLQTNGAGAPSWVTPSSGALVLISTLTASASSSLTWTGLTTYNNYIVILDSLVPTVADSLELRLGYGATPTYSASSFVTSQLKFYGSSNVVYSRGTGDRIYLAGFANSQGSDSLTGAKGTINLFNTLVSSKDVAYSYMVSYSIDGNASVPENSIGNGWWPSTPSAITAVRLIYTSQTIASGKASLYGIVS
jgi:hypothetical protein